MHRKSRSAWSFVDGKQLADLMIDSNIEVNVTQKYEMKRLDSDY